MSGTVYVVRSSTGLTKIGYTSRAPEKRINELKNGHPGGVWLEYAWPGTPQLEKDIHRRLARYRENGEWFRLPVGWVDALSDLVMDADVGTLSRLHGHAELLVEQLEISGCDDVTVGMLLDCMACAGLVLVEAPGAASAAYFTEAGWRR